MTEVFQTIQSAGSAVADATGQAIVAVGPGAPYVGWLLTRMTVQVPGETGSPECRVYMNTAGSGTLIDSTYSGALDTSDFSTPHKVQPGESLVAVWVGVTPGLTCYLTVAGDGYRT